MRKGFFFLSILEFLIVVTLMPQLCVRSMSGIVIRKKCQPAAGTKIKVLESPKSLEYIVCEP